MITGTIDDTRGLNLKRDGIAFLRSAISEQLVNEFRSLADAAYSLIENPDSISDDRASLAREVAKSSAQWGGIPIDHVISLSADKQRAAIVLDEIKSTLASKIASRVSYLADFKSELSYVRRHRDTSTYAPWHFDAYAAGTIDHDPVYNAWVPLVPVGHDKPGLEFIPGTSNNMRAERYEKWKDGYPANGWIAERRSKRVCVPLQPGDIAIFDHYTLHQTQISDFQPYIRTSAEMRFSLKNMPKVPVLQRITNALRT
jgi:ectoine hydroxylase-related dioxygenase (phytanoyl-CoA dioxygenase family)